MDGPTIWRKPSPNINSLIFLVSFALFLPGTLCGFDFRDVRLELLNGHAVDAVFPKSHFKMNIAIGFMVINAENAVAWRILAYPMVG